MAYYVSVIDNSKVMYAAGPFKRHGDALKTVDAVRKMVHERYPREAPWVGYGTCNIKTSHAKIGKFNQELGVPAWKEQEAA